MISADFNGDGKPDFAAQSALYRTSHKYLGCVPGKWRWHFSSRRFLRPVPEQRRGIAAASLNGDGKPDVAMVYANCTQGALLPGYVAVLVGNGDGTFQTPVPYATGLQPDSVVIGDFNGDGKPDLATANSTSNNISILLNHGNGTFPTHVEYKPDLSPGNIISGDFNGDGKLDLVVTTGRPECPFF